MTLTMLESMERQLDDMLSELLFWRDTRARTKDKNLIAKCGREIFKEQYRIKQTTEAIVKYREKHEKN